MPVRYYTHGRRDQMKVALTFDDGPNPPRTDQVTADWARRQMSAPLSSHRADHVCSILWACYDLRITY